MRFLVQALVVVYALQTAVGNVVFDVDAGSTSDLELLVNGPGQPKKFELPNAEIGNTTEDTRFSTNRYGSFSYVFPDLEAGDYIVSLGFAELNNCSGGVRKFDVAIQDVSVLSNFDVFQEAGTCSSAVTFPVTVTLLSAGSISVEFLAIAGLGEPFVSSLLVESVAPATLEPTTLVASTTTSQEELSTLIGDSSTTTGILTTTSTEITSLAQTSTTTGLIFASSSELLTTELEASTTTATEPDASEQITTRAETSLASSFELPVTSEQITTVSVPTMTDVGTVLMSSAGVSSSVESVLTSTAEASSSTSAAEESSFSDSQSSTQSSITAEFSSSTPIPATTVAATLVSETTGIGNVATSFITSAPSITTSKVPSSSEGSSSTSTISSSTGSLSSTAELIASSAVAASITGEDSTTQPGEFSTLDEVDSTAEVDATSSEASSASTEATSGTTSSVPVSSLVSEEVPDTGEPAPAAGTFDGSDEIFIDAGSLSEDSSFFSQVSGSRFGGNAVRIEGTDDEVPFRTHRWGVFTYTIPVAAGSYQVELGFAETWSPACTTGFRQMTVRINGDEALSDFSVFDAASASCRTAVVRVFDVSVSAEESLVIEFLRVIQNPMVSYIKVRDSFGATMPPSSSLPDTLTSVAASTLTSTLSTSSSLALVSTSAGASTSAVTSSSSALVSTSVGASTSAVTSSVFETSSTLSVSSKTVTGSSSGPTVTPVQPAVVLVDVDAGSGEEDDSLAIGPGQPRKYKTGPQDIQNTEDDSRFISHRYGPLAYTFSGFSPGTYSVQVGFAETWAPNCELGTRVFSVVANGETVASDLDVFAQVGCNAAYFLNFASIVDSDGLIEVEFVQGPGNEPFVSSIVIGTGELPGTAPPTSSSGSNATTTLSSSSLISSETTSSVAPSGAVTSTSGEYLVLDIDAGSTSDDDSLVTGFRQPRKHVAEPRPIANTADESRFLTQRYGQFFYTFSGFEPGTYTFELGFAEVWEPNCVVGQRVFNVLANGEIVVASLDIFAAAGCNAAEFRSFSVEVLEGSDVQLRFQAVSGDLPLVSSIKVFSDASADTTSTVASTSSVSTSSVLTTSQATMTFNGALMTAFTVNAGSSSDLDGNVLCEGSCQKVVTATGPITGTDEDALFLSYRSGLSFSYEFNMVPDVYDVTLGFAETVVGNCANGSRVFNVKINEVSSEAMSNIDVFRAARGCNSALELSTSVEVTGVLKVEFEAILDDAFVSYIRVASSAGCSLVIGNNGDSDHRAHAVAGTYPQQLNADSPKSYVDLDGNGEESVFINGFQSHTHYQDKTDPNNIVSGSIVEYKWTNLESGETIANSQNFTRDFPLGTTRLLLEVVDSTCDRSESETTVTVTGSVSPGSYCYYYETSISLLSGGVGADTTVKPLYAAERQGDFGGVLASPPSFGNDVYAVRCQFFYEVEDDSELSTLAVSTAGTGSAQVFKGDSLVLDTRETPSAGVPLATGLTSFEVLYLRDSTSSDPVLTFSINGTSIEGSKISYDRRTVVPILQDVSPSGSAVAGGVDLVVNGYGIFTQPLVYFGDVQVLSSATGLTQSSFRVTTPSMPEGSVKLTVRASVDGVASNGLDFQFGDGVPPPVAFSRKVVQESDGSEARSNIGTTIKVWGGVYYIGALGGFVRMLWVDEEYVVTRKCRGPTLLDDELLDTSGNPAPVDVLGLAFDPSDTEGRPYVSVQTLYWFYESKVNPSNPKVWENGRIERLKPEGNCLAYDRRIVSGLPVSDHDHGVNGLEFDNDGNLYAAIGGATNAGLPSSSFGVAYETPLSAAIVKILLSKGASFDGVVTYSEGFDNHRNAVKLSGDVEVFATGFRNPFDLAFTSQEEWFCTDNGPNEGFGRFALECTDTRDDGASSFNRVDRINKVTAGGFYGHPNINRGECQYIDPFTDKDVLGREPAPSLNYVPELHTTRSSCNGIMEYTASHFGSALKGELIATHFAPGDQGLVQRIRPGGGLQDVDANWGGLAVAQGVFGELIFSRVGVRNNLHVLEPDYSFPSGLSARVVSPFRGGRSGGLTVIVTGHGFGTGSPSVLFNGIACAIVPGSVVETVRGSKLECVTPPSSSGGLVDVSVAIGGSVSVISGGFMYANV